MTPTAWSEIDTPLGAMRAEALDDGIVRLEFADVGRALPAAPQPWRPVAALQGSAGAHLSRLAEELSAYFAGRLTDFTVPLATATGTPFQQAAWGYLRSIPFGQTRTYGQQAAAMGSPLAARAVGGANGSNPLCLIVPCHRVVGRGGSLTGFAAGVDRKRWLLNHERAVLAGMTESGRVGPGRAQPASRATDAVPVGRDPRASRGLRPPRAETARLRFRAPTLETPSWFA